MEGVLHYSDALAARRRSGRDGRQLALESRSRTRWRPHITRTVYY
jgi:hypothetical protein